MNARAPITLLALLTITTQSLAQDATPAAAHVADQDGRVPAIEQPAQPHAQPDFTTADQVLDALEAVHIDKLSANIRYTKISEFLGEREMRIGTMQFISTPREGKPDARKFGVAFDSLIIGNIKDDEPKIYIFDGHWLVEKFPNQKRMNRREVVRPGEEVDPLRIGEGPFPIPIGQKKADILKRFDAELLPAGDGLTIDPDDPNDESADDPQAIASAEWLVKFTKDAFQIRLTPKEEFKDTLDLAEARLWYKFNKDGTLLPCLARSVDFDGNISIVELLSVKLGDAANVDDDMFDVEAPDDWDVDSRDFGG